MAGHDLLVGGDDVLSERDALEYAVQGRVPPAHELDHDVDIGVVEDVLDPVRERSGRKAAVALLASVADEDALKKHGAAD